MVKAPRTITAIKYVQHEGLLISAKCCDSCSSETLIPSSLKCEPLSYGNSAAGHWKRFLIKTALKQIKSDLLCVGLHHFAERGEILMITPLAESCQCLWGVNVSPQGHTRLTQ